MKLNCPIWYSSDVLTSYAHRFLPVPAGPAHQTLKLIGSCLHLCRCPTSARAGFPTSSLSTLQKFWSEGDLRHSFKASLKWPLPSPPPAINNLSPVPMAPTEVPALNYRHQRESAILVYQPRDGELSGKMGAGVEVRAGLMKVI